MNHIKTSIDDQTYFDTKRSKDFEVMSYKDQLKNKQALIEKLFEGSKVNPIIANKPDRGYRHKVVLSAVNVKTSNRTYKIKLGLYEEGTKTITPKLNHFVHDAKINEIFESIEKILQKYKIKAYHPNDRSGMIKHVLIRKSYALNEVIVVFVTMGYILPNHKQMIKDLVELHPEIKTVVQNIHDRETPIVLLDKEKILYGTGYIKDKIGDLTFRISAKAFYQVNPKQMDTLYQKALDMAKISSNDIVMDCYSGIGTISLLLAKKAKEVVAVEVNKVSVEDAMYNKRLNEINNVMFYAADVEPFMQNFDKKVDILFMDPTRDGASEGFINSLKVLKPKKIVYISCDPYTQTRDIKQLKSLYEIKEIQPVDMFSYSAHVETIVLLSHKNPQTSPPSL